MFCVFCVFVSLCVALCRSQKYRKTREKRFVSLMFVFCVTVFCVCVTVFCVCVSVFCVLVHVFSFFCLMSKQK